MEIKTFNGRFGCYLTMMFIMATSVVQELGIMHLVTSSKFYKIILGVVTQPLGKVNEICTRVGKIYCFVTFMIIDTNNDYLIIETNNDVGVRFFDQNKGYCRCEEGDNPS